MGEDRIISIVSV